jgi:hypothetical protein
MNLKDNLGFLCWQKRSRCSVRAKNALAIAITVRVPHILIKSQFVCNLKSKLWPRRCSLPRIAHSTPGSFRSACISFAPCGKLHGANCITFHSSGRLLGSFFEAARRTCTRQYNDARIMIDLSRSMMGKLPKIFSARCRQKSANAAHTHREERHNVSAERNLPPWEKRWLLL